MYFFFCRVQKCLSEEFPQPELSNKVSNNQPILSGSSNWLLFSRNFLLLQTFLYAKRRITLSPLFFWQSLQSSFPRQDLLSRRTLESCSSRYTEEETSVRSWWCSATRCKVRSTICATVINIDWRRRWEDTVTSITYYWEQNVVFFWFGAFCELKASDYLETNYAFFTPKRW